jgi:TPR repeat protein
VLVGPRGLGNTQQYERELAFVRQTRDPAFPIVPVILPENRTDPPFDFLRVLTWIDFSHVARVFDAPDVLEQLLTAIHGGKTSAAGPRDTICPYRGLDVFREEDSAFFFGRGSADDPDSAIGQLVRKVREHPFVVVVGRSGSGKSSLVHAGLLPALRRERDRFWYVLSLQPGAEPLRALAAAFNPRSEDEGAAQYAKRITKEADELRTGNPELLAHMIREELGQAEGKPDRLLLYVDQWEELYAQAPPSSDKARVAQHAADVNRFINLLLTAAKTTPVAVVATVRADFYDPLIANQEIKALLPTHQILLGSMLRSELESTIVQPARKIGLTFDPPTLMQRILDDAGEDDGMLPLLQYALKETWELREGNTITADSYTRSGGVREAIRITAEQTFDALSPADQQAARQLFLRLVIPGEGQEDTRTRAAMPVDEAQRKIVEQFAAPQTRLLVTGFDRAARPTVEVAHEALIRTWPRLRQWIDANREKLRSRAAILRDRSDWEQNGRRGDMLLPAGLQLERARTLLADPGDIPIEDIKEFIQLSSERDEAARTRIAETQRKRMRNRGFALAGVSFLAMLAGFLGLVANQQRKEAIQQRIEAEDQRKQANEILAGATNFFTSPEEGGTQTEAFVETALQLFRRGAERGDNTSMYLLGELYSRSKRQDYAKAREWYEKAAERGNVSGMERLGRMYQDGLGVTKDLVRAHEWYEKAEEKGNAKAAAAIKDLISTSLVYMRSRPHDYVKAREWAEKAAEKGKDYGMERLGWMYENGRGVLRDYVKAREWYEKAAKRGSNYAMARLGWMYQNGLGVPQDYVKARELYEKVAEKGNVYGMEWLDWMYQGNDSGMERLGWMYQNGLGVPQDYVKAREWYERAADKYNPDAMTNLGLLYLNGWGVPQDYVKAREWFERAVDKGDPGAMTNLGLLYSNGWGVPQDYVKAREWSERAADPDAMRKLPWPERAVDPDPMIKAHEWYEKAAEKGNDYGMERLGWMYENGRGVPQDYVKAREWYEKAAEKSNDYGMERLGWMYQNGLGVTKDLVRAFEWFEAAADKGNPDAMTNLGLLYLNGWGVPQDYVKAFEWFEAAVDKGNPDAMTSLGFLYLNGFGVAENYVEAREWFEAAANKGNSNAMTYLGVLYFNGWGVAQDYEKAREWFEVAAEKGNPDALINLGLLYFNGWGVAQDYVKALEWFEGAADKGNPDAMTWSEKAAEKGNDYERLGWIYENGRGVPQDYVKAREWYEKAAERGNVSGMEQLGRMYQDGLGVPQDYVKAREWYEKAAEKGNDYGMERLGWMYQNGLGVPQDYVKAREWYEQPRINTTRTPRPTLACFIPMAGAYRRTMSRRANGMKRPWIGAMRALRQS